jgi:hypothetical protein
MRPFMIRWIKSILAEWKIFEEEPQIISYSWDAFFHSLKTYKNFSIPVPSHFHTYSKYFLKTELIEKGKYITKEFIEGCELLPLEQVSSLSEYYIVDRIITLKGFRQCLEPPHLQIFDAELMSLYPSNKFKINEKNEKLISASRYWEARKVMKTIILFLLTGKGSKRNKKRTDSKKTYNRSTK